MEKTNENITNIENLKDTQNIFDSLKSNFKGDIDTTDASLKTYSNDASLFEIRPRVIVFPKDSTDIKALVKWVNENKEKDPTLSITARSAGTDMSGAAIGSSIIVDFTRYMNVIVQVESEFAIVQPGCYYRDFDAATQKINRFMPAYTASREINAVGGMVGNNSGGEKAIKYGKTENFINSLKVILSDGEEYEIKSLTKAELEQKIAGGAGFETELYKKLYALITENYDEIMKAKPAVSKNSAGYYLWNVYNREAGTFDLCQLIVGSQGTLGIVSEINFRIVPTQPCSNILVVFLPSLNDVSKLVTEIVPFKPDSLETYDDKSMILAVRFFFDFFKQLGFWGAIKLGLQFIPETWMIMIGGVPKLILMIEFTGENEADVKRKLMEVEQQIKHFGFHMHIAHSSAEANKYWKIRHESFNLLRKHVKNKRTAPFIDDIIVKPEYLPEFLPKVKALLDEYKLDYTVQGHLGNGNFHIIPLMDLNSPFSADIILELSAKVYTLVNEYHGSITAEHNDGIIRTPYLLQQYGQNIVNLFQKTKETFDPQNIFNPGKKVGGTFQNIKDAIKKKN
ncbi:MAG: FAD-binding oxidoreductase [Candidatus Pacebacteria bacterium]|nr:FAD-binding oxidoreductase [Candidatus Paceibacterota bacterium]